ncbi:MAG: N-acetylglucosamine-6-phosphate deacetylase [Campylobacterales bacterium]|nr:N-acetylglucosamine-6-phosphate deacetylase [Campylobacterales bacterium]
MLSAIINSKLIIADTIVENKVVIFDEKIHSIVDKDRLPKNVKVIDVDGAYLGGGFIDIHIHGSGGSDVMDATKESLETISESIVKNGTTSFLATTMTMDLHSIEKALENIQVNASSVNGANILGAHMEGPFINPKKCGAQDKKYIIDPDTSFIDRYKDIIKMITLAPEVEGADAFVKYIKKHYPHIILSVGHSDATYEQTMHALDLGIDHATHLGNAMNVMHHRAPGVIGAVLDSDITCDVIADRIHLHDATLRTFWCIKKERLMLITDSMRAGCMCEGSYDLGGQVVNVEKGKATLQNGQLAGSVLRLNEALRNMREITDISIPQALFCVTEAPARKLGIKKGRIEEGYDADMVVFDENFDILLTIVDGQIKYKKGA